MSVISIIGLTLGYLTLPPTSAAGLLGSYLVRNAELSGLMLPLPFSDHALALSDRCLEQVQALAVERGHRRVIHLIGRNLEHLVLEIDGVAGGTRLKAGLAILVEGVATAIGGRDMAGG